METHQYPAKRESLTRFARRPIGRDVSKSELEGMIERLETAQTEMYKELDARIKRLERLLLDQTRVYDTRTQ
jgi:hypothetical protein